jgi:hypothetical protein
MDQFEEDMPEQEIQPPQYFALFDSQTGGIVTFFVDAIHGENIPSEAVPITVEEWQTYSAEPWTWKRDGDTVRLRTPEELEEERANQPPAPKTPDQEMNEQIATLLIDSAAKDVQIQQQDAIIADLMLQVAALQTASGGGGA